jgi:hypothetical protein
MSTDGNEEPAYQAYWRAYQKERQEQFATGVDAVPLDVSELRRAMSLLVREDIDKRGSRMNAGRLNLPTSQ